MPNLIFNKTYEKGTIKTVNNNTPLSRFYFFYYDEEDNKIYGSGNHFDQTQDFVRIIWNRLKEMGVKE